jgi:sortase A
MPAQTTFIYYKYPDSYYLHLNKKFSLKKILSKIFLGFGMAITVWVAYPVVSFQLINSRQLARARFISPLGAIPKYSSFNAPIEQTDYTKAGNWFPNFNTAITTPPLNDYTLSIPKLKINKATVSLIEEDLSQSLIHYNGTALPGNKGNGVIFGHSILPQFYNPKNYMAIFSTLHTLEKGDQIILYYDNITYQYQIIDMFEVTPEDISVLDQTYDSEYLTLITCTPPGTYLRRLIVKAKLIPYQT